MAKRKEEKLRDKNKKELLEYASKSGLAPRKSWTKDKIIEFITKELSAAPESSLKTAPQKKKQARSKEMEEYLKQSHPGSIPPGSSPIDNMTDVEKSKYEMGIVEPEARKEEFPIPESYDDDRLVLLPRDPSWLFSYWEISSHLIKSVQEALGDDFSHAKPTLRIHLLNKGKSSFFDIDVFLKAKNWYIQVPEPGVQYTAELGFKHGLKFYSILKSNSVRTPAASVSDEIDERWMAVDNLFKEIYGMAAGVDPDSQSSFGFKQQISEIYRQSVSSGDIQSGSPVIKKSQAEDTPRFSIDTEIILYGSAEPGARIRVNGEQVYVRPDGSFTLRFALPEGNFPIECEVYSPGGEKKETVIPVISRKTQ